MRMLLLLVLPVAVLLACCSPKPEVERAPEAKAEACRVHAQSVLIELSYLLGKDASEFARWCRSKEGQLSDALGGLQCEGAVPFTEAWGRGLVANIPKSGRVTSMVWLFGMHESEWVRFKQDVSIAFGQPWIDTEEPKWVNDNVIYDSYAVRKEIPPPRDIIYGSISVRRCDPENANHSVIPGCRAVFGTTE